MKRPTRQPTSSQGASRPPSPTRREVLALGAWSALGGLLGFGCVRAAPPPPAGDRGSRAQALRALDRFIMGYREAMNAPGITLALADAAGPIRLSSYGYVDLNALIPVRTSDLFQIGSISKSFAALVVLQLHEEGKVDLQSPIRHYLPWLAMQSDYGEILVHHLLTHSSGMPEDAPVFPSEPGRRPRQAFVPGSEFHYSNWGYGVLGHLIESLDGRPWPLALTARILTPLGMSNTLPAITSADRARIAQSYVPLHDDRPYPRKGPLAVAGGLETEDASGSIVSCPSDMSAYMRMILNGGAHPGGRIVSADSFKRFSTPYIAAPDFGPTASYGYGIAIDELDGHRRLKHTGGMVSFMSAIHLDLDAGFGAFVSVNAQLGYRPNPVAQLALRLLRSAKEQTPTPVIPAFDESASVANPASYQGIFTAADGRHLEVSVTGAEVLLVRGEARIPLQHVEDDTFLADHADLELYPLVFEREGDPTSAVIALAHGSDWYARAATHARAIAPSPELARYVGAYYSADPWHGWVRVVQRQGRLWIDGTDPLTPIGDRLFRVGDKLTSPETAEFSDLVEGAAWQLRFDGGQFERIEVA
jgi:CubicO group peptidase (beta-lactamase class C family)